MATTSVPPGTIDATGIHVPDMSTILAALIADYTGIYGSDVNLGNDTQDGEWLGIMAAALNDAYAFGVAVYNAKSPATALGVSLSSIVKLNGLMREVASYSMADVVLIGQAGTIVTNGQVRDAAGNLWSLPAVVTIDQTGQATVTATCAVLGAVSAAAGTISSIATFVRGWQSVSNAAPATLGAPVETDAALRIRQSQSTMLPSQTVLDGILADIATIPGVARLRAYENDTDTVDVNGTPAHGTAYVVDGGDAVAICQAIALKKTQGTPTYGTTVETVLVGKASTPRQIRFFRPSEPSITYLITVKSLNGYTVDVQAQLQQAVSDWTNAQGIGVSISIEDVRGPALLPNYVGTRPYKIVSILAARDGAIPQDADISIAFNEAAYCVPAYVNVAVQTS